MIDKLKFGTLGVHVCLSLHVLVCFFSDLYEWRYKGGRSQAFLDDRQKQRAVIEFLFAKGKLLVNI